MTNLNKTAYTVGLVGNIGEENAKVLRYVSTYAWNVEQAVKEAASMVKSNPDHPLKGTLVLASIKQGVTSQEDIEFSFGDALYLMRQGCFVARKGWNGKGMYLWLLREATIEKSWVKDPALLSAFGNQDKLECLPSIRMFTADQKVLTGWLASQTDMQAYDWVVVKYPEDADKYCEGC